ncbi:benzoate transport [Bowdeniella nasicola]|uniref:Benzoate transport n=1 Tax=Bowdeniella nasicola TaxID=208480 RepID=A0A1H3YAK6_9ACTO|nr:MFS transporter [Bowdeniella nasicola]SEA07962.1 benzoate transport [Bowdeniella nasicola]
MTTTREHLPSTTADSGDSRYRWKAVWASMVGYAMDGFDFLILGFALLAISAAPADGGLGLSQTEAGSLATYTLLGAVLGGFIFGALADTYGRVRVLMWSIIIFAVFTALTGLAQNYWQIALFRFIAGVGIGAEYGIGMTLAAEAWPAKLRAKATSFVAIGWQVGVLAATFVSAAVVYHWGWRVLFFIGVLPALVAVLVRHTVEEPAAFEERKAEGIGRSLKDRFPIHELVKDARTTKTSLGITILTSVQNFGYYGLMIWLPTFLSKTHGLSIQKSAVWTGVTVLGMMIGIMAFGYLADHLGRKPAFIAFQIGAVVSVIAYAQLATEMSLLIGGFFLGMFVNGMMGGYGAVTAESYPTHSRATAQNVLFNIGRGVGGFAPLVVGSIAAAYSFQLAVGLLAIIYVIDIIATLFLIPETKDVEIA